MMDKQFARMGDRCRIAYRFHGPVDAPVLLLSNSLGTNMDMWAAQIDSFAQSFRVLCYDSRGHGASDAPVGAYSMDRLGRDAMELLDELKIDRVHFCGLSKGGMVGQWLGVHAAERIDRLILANTAAYMGPPSNWQARIDGVMKDGVGPLAEASIARWFTPDFPNSNPDAVAPIRAMLLANDPQGYAGCCAAIRDMDQRPTNQLISAPTLVIVGSQDPSTPPAEGAAIAEVVRNGRLVALNAAHLSNVEQPEAFTQAVLAFLHA